jgi:pyruvate ferredoxin oxidoreductase alpha subunit
MCEMLSYVSGARHPVVMVDTNRATATPWSIYGDHRDALAMRDAGWIMFFVESGQEALDTVIQSFKLAEHSEVMTPVMVNLDGFTLSHTYDLVEIPDQAMVDRFLPPYNTTNRMNMDDPKTLCHSVGPDFHAEVRVLQQEAFERAKRKIVEIDAEYGKMFGRSYGGLVEEYKADDAEYVLVALGSMAGTIRVCVDMLREKGEKAGMIKVRSFRPFPKEYFASLRGRFKSLGVMSRDISFGYEGTLFTEIKAAMSCQTTKFNNYIAGLGGRDIPKTLILDLFEKSKQAASGKNMDEVQFVGLRWDYYGS